MKKSYGSYCITEYFTFEGGWTIPLAAANIGSDRVIILPPVDYLSALPFQGVHLIALLVEMHKIHVTNICYEHIKSSIPSCQGPLAWKIPIHQCTKTATMPPTIVLQNRLRCGMLLYILDCHAIYAPSICNIKYRIFNIHSGFQIKALCYKNKQDL